MPSRDGGADLAELARTLTELAEKSRSVAQQFMVKQAKSDGFQIPDPGVVGSDPAGHATFQEGAV